MRVVLIRHPAVLITPGLCYGRLDVGLAPSAAADVARLSSDPRLVGAARVWSSPAVRCRGPADAVARRLLVPLAIDARLWELDFGAWEGRAWDTVSRTELDRWAASPLTFTPPGGESGADLIARIRSFHGALLQDQRDCVVVSHGGPLKVLSALLLGRPIDLLATPPGIGSIQPILCTTAAPAV